MNAGLTCLLGVAAFLLPMSMALAASSIRVMGFGAAGANLEYVPALPAVFGNRSEKITVSIEGTIAGPAYLRADLFQVAGKLAMPLAKDMHLLEGITFSNGDVQTLAASIKMPDVKQRTQILVQLALVAGGAQSSPVHLLDTRFEVFPASVTKELADLLQPKPGGDSPVVVFGMGQKIRHFLTGLHVTFEDAGLEMPDRLDPSRFYFGELTSDEQFQQAQDRSAGARLALFSTDESLPEGVYAERSSSGVLVHVTSPLLDNLEDDPRAQLGFIKIIHLLSAPPSSAN